MPPSFPPNRSQPQQQWVNKQMSVSVVIPAYNAGSYIRQAIESVLAQTLPADEIIVVDDGSSDDTCAIATSYAPRVRLVRQKNQGPSAARNTGVQVASSEFVAFLDADDRWLPHKLEAQLIALRSTPGAVLSFTSLLMDHPDGSQTVQPAVAPADVPALLRLGNPAILPSCVMLSRSAMLAAGGFPPHLTIGEDWSLWLRLLALGPFCAVSQPLTRYRVSNSGVSGNAGLMLADAKRILDDQLLTGLTGPSRWLWRRRILSHQYFKAALTARSSGQHGQELSYLRQSFTTWPSPFWQPLRLKVLLVTLRRSFR